MSDGIDPTTGQYTEHNDDGITADDFTKVDEGAHADGEGRGELVSTDEPPAIDEAAEGAAAAAEQDQAEASGYTITDQADIQNF
jgi:hypothetical protein